MFRLIGFFNSWSISLGGCVDIIWSGGIILFRIFWVFG